VNPLSFTLLFPVILLAIFGSVFKDTIAPGVTFSQYFVAGMIASGLVNTGFQALAITIPMERDFGALKRLRGTPMPASSYFIGKAILDLCQYGYSNSLAIGLWCPLLWSRDANRS
jgi:ABC-2 type transport system permease protein